ncbi:unnamed protein product [Cylindrotheca closterium]|uniref:Ion transport domain-containing protein n=1 Tax=Cylindrotheca closterium TaxID=2856 RepID=A0AAD2G1U2_9STRA|nr:unnamed protein product [Cylindrotheca closterium]
MEDEKVDIVHESDDASSNSSNSSKLDTLGPLRSSSRGGIEESESSDTDSSSIGRYSSRMQSIRFESDSPVGKVRSVQMANRLTKMDSIKQGVMMSPTSGRRSGLIVQSLQDDLRKSQALLDVRAVDNVGGELQEQWMEVYNKNVMNLEPIDETKYDDFVWSRLILMQDFKGMLLLHHACRRKAPYETVKWFIGDESDIITLSHRAKDGSLPIHIACRAFASFDVVQLVSKDSNRQSYINVPDKEGRLPLDIFGSGVSSGQNRKSQSRAMQTFTENMFKSLIREKDANIEETFMAMDSICNNCPPKKFQTIVCNNLHEKVCIQWLTWAFCQQKVISSIMRDFYCKVAWIAILMQSSSLYLKGKRTDGYAYALYFFTLIFLVREIKQVRRYIKAQVLVDYVKEIWNWVDVAVICLVATSATILLLDDPSGGYNERARTVLMVTNAFQLLHFASFLKKIFLPFATFVGGLMMLFKTLLPFMVCTSLVLLAFAFMYHVSKFDRNNPLPPDQLQFSTLWVSFLSVFQMFVDAPEETASMLDAAFGVVTTIVLLNVVIAVISISWDKSTEEEKALRVFWEYRLTFIQDVTLSRKAQISAKKMKKLMRLNTFSDRFDQARSDRMERFHDPSQKNGIGLYFFFVTQYAVYFCLGWVTFGYFWPFKIRKDIFGIKFRPPIIDTKSEIIETRKVHDTVTKRMDELEGKITKQNSDNLTLLAQNQNLNRKMDDLESSIDKLTKLLTQQQGPSSQPKEPSFDDSAIDVPARSSSPDDSAVEVPTRTPSPDDSAIEVPARRFEPDDSARTSSALSVGSPESYKRILPSGQVVTSDITGSDSGDESDENQTHYKA